MSDAQRIYRVIFQNQGHVVEMFARQVAQGGLFGFVEIEDLIFGTRNQVVVDPGEENLKSEFEGVKRIYVPLHAIVRIDEVEREGVSRMRDGKKGAESSSVRAFPVPVHPGRDSPPK